MRAFVRFLREKNITPRNFIGKLLKFMNQMRCQGQLFPGKSSKGIVLLHDNATPRSARLTRRLLQKFKWEVWSPPAYSCTDLSPYNYNVIGPFKQDLVQHFDIEKEVQYSVVHWLRENYKFIFYYPNKMKLSRYLYIPSLKWHVINVKYGSDLPAYIGNRLKMI